MGRESLAHLSHSDFSHIHQDWESVKTEAACFLTRKIPPRKTEDTSVIEEG